MPTTMQMDGFATLDGTHACVVFLSRHFVVDTWGKLAAALAITLGMGIALGGCVRFRVSYHASFTTVAGRALLALSFAAQLTLGYLLMLVAMTYQLELFAAVVVGVAAGFALSVPHRQSPGVECCVSHASASPLDAPTTPLLRPGV